MGNREKIIKQLEKEFKEEEKLYGITTENIIRSLWAWITEKHASEEPRTIMLKWFGSFSYMPTMALKKYKYLKSPTLREKMEKIFMNSPYIKLMHEEKVTEEDYKRYLELKEAGLLIRSPLAQHRYDAYQAKLERLNKLKNNNNED